MCRKVHSILDSPLLMSYVMFSLMLALRFQTVAKRMLQVMKILSLEQNLHKACECTLSAPCEII